MTKLCLPIKLSDVHCTNSQHNKIIPGNSVHILIHRIFYIYFVIDQELLSYN